MAAHAECRCRLSTYRPEAQTSACELSKGQGEGGGGDEVGGEGGREEKGGGEEEGVILKPSTF